MSKMLKWVVTVLGSLTGLAGYVFVTRYSEMVIVHGLALFLFGLIVAALVSGGIFYVLSPWLINLGRNFANWIINELSGVPVEKLVAGSAGLIGGLIVAYLISGLLANIPVPFIGAILSVVVYLFMGYLGINLATKAGELVSLGNVLRRNVLREDSQSKRGSVIREGIPKILDTSVIIDGRIADICRTGFVEGPLIIPEFVLEELRHIADSSATLKRNRGRRGLDVLAIIQKDLKVEVKIVSQDFPDVNEVDIKLLKLAQSISGKVVTNDYNLNKVASLQGVDVLNINELANAVKPVVLPGEEMQIEVIKDGKEAGQGLAYLDDGTMIVVENGRKYIGENIEVLVTSVLQTAAGRMIFAKPKN
ncbi:MAG: PIN/TRAM domain-containing protein [Bacillota bacterium]|nr:PIN/TRAM domain-containing protein [Bacillota bacterium]MDW7677136.1 PIN/TRAM domain-containing protein [Bacillota bacterium]